MFEKPSKNNGLGSPPAALIKSAEISKLIQEGLALHQSGRLGDAETIYKRILHEHSNQFDALHLLGVICAQRKQHESALRFFDLALQTGKTSASVFTNRGTSLKELQRFDEALVSYNEAIRIKPDYAEAYNNRGNTLAKLRRLEEALASYDEAIRIKPDYAEAYNNRGNVLIELQHLDRALTSFGKALRIRPDDEKTLVNQGDTLFRLQRFQEALESYDQALLVEPDNAETYNDRGIVLEELMRFEEALASYDEALRINPNYFDALNNRANSLVALGRPEEALSNYDKALEIKPGAAGILSNRANVLVKLRRSDEALASYERALRLDPDYVDALNNRGNLFFELRRLEEALASYEEALRIKPTYDLLLGQLIHTKMYLCQWDRFENAISTLAESISEGKLVTLPFQMIALIDDPALQNKCAAAYSKATFPDLEHKATTRHSKKSKKPAIGYFSADFHNHATLHLMMDIFRNHNRFEFDFFAFSFGPPKIDEWRSEITALFSKFIDVCDQSDAQVAKASQDLGIDIAIDLKGYTAHSRAGIFLHRAAPIQINYLGYPGTMGASFMDYIIADKVVIPTESLGHYTEKVLYLPNCYQPNMRERKISDKLFKRGDFGLPDQGVIFCSFNQIYKLIPNIFGLWMDILKGVEQSVLWVMVTSETAKKNLKAETQAHGVDPKRLIFADPLAIEEHLKRVALGDIFLDTFPYNAHTTASDAIRMGVPMVTLMGRSFASRVAASILTTVGLPDLITETEEGYKALAIKLGNDPDALKAVKERLKANLETSALFDSKAYTRDLEAIYSELLQ